MMTTMAMARRATAQRDAMTKTMAMGDDDNDDDNIGDGAMGNEVDDDGDDNVYGNGRQRRRWRRHNGRGRDEIRR